MSRLRKRSAIGRRTLISAAGSLILPAPAVRAQGGTAAVALVIGNSRYQWEAPLPNVRRDAPDIAKRFQALGLRTELLQDAGRDAMLQALDKFATVCRGASFAATYFAGHGATWQKAMYLVPLDADLSAPSAVERCIPSDVIDEATKDAGHRLHLYDNCRNNPADGWRQTEAERQAVIAQGYELARVPNTLSLQSTAPGRVALDGPAGQNSPFAAAVLRQLAGQVDLQAMEPKVRRDVLIATQGRQVVFGRSSHQQPFLIGRGPPAASLPADPAKVVELPNAYAFAQENGLSLVRGLIAHRPAGASPHAAKIGSYKYEATFAGVRNPQILIVMSVEDSRSVELIVAGKSDRRYWRFVTAAFSGNTLEYVPREGSRRYRFDWSDANSGRLTQSVVEGSGPPPGRQLQGGGPGHVRPLPAGDITSRFTRLDG